MRSSDIIFAAAALYGAAGLFIAIAFALHFAAKVDHNTRGASHLFRILIVPGCAALWPVVLVWIFAGSGAMQSEEPSR